MIAHTTSGKVLVLAPLDYVIWNIQAADTVGKSVGVLHPRPSSILFARLNAMQLAMIG